MRRLRVTSPAPILLVTARLAREELARLVGHPFQDMVKFVADIERRILAVGGECIEYQSLINMRPSQGNKSTGVLDAGRRERIRAIVFELIGRGEDLA